MRLPVKFKYHKWAAVALEIIENFHASECVARKSRKNSLWGTQYHIEVKRNQVVSVPHSALLSHKSSVYY